MKIEHIGLNVKDPVQAAQWYARNLAMKIVKSSDQPPFGHFLADSAGCVMIEFYNNDQAPLPDYFQIDVLTLHLAFVTNNIEADMKRLMAAGGQPGSPISTGKTGDKVGAVRDPWGVPVQLIQRAKPMF